MKTILHIILALCTGMLISSCALVIDTGPTPTNTALPSITPTFANTATPTPTPRPLRMVVDATKGWQRTGVVVEKHKPFEIRYISGTWTHFMGGTAPFGPEGSQYTCSVSNCCEPLPGVPSGALIGKVGGETFLISLGGPFAINSSGPLFVRINDCDTGLNDNNGEIIIEIIP